MRIRIEICGGIAAGKTTLAEVLEQNGYTAIYERFEDNPFVKQFYQSAEQDSTFETEIVFTLLHYNPIKQKQNEKMVVSDYSLLQDYCYGIQNLHGMGRKVFENMYDYLLDTLEPADLIIYLKCEADCLLERIHARSRENEMTIYKEYLQGNIDALEKFLKEKEKVLTIDSQKYDFRQPHKKEVIELISEALSRP